MNRHYDLHFQMTMIVKATPKTIDELHDRLARRFIKALDKEFGGNPLYIRDCKTGRFRKL